MEAAVATPSLLFSSPSPRRPSSCLPLPPCSSSSYSPHGAKLQQPQLLFANRISRNSKRSSRSIWSLRFSSSATDSAFSSASSERWVLEPAGDTWGRLGNTGVPSHSGRMTRREHFQTRRSWREIRDSSLMRFCFCRNSQPIHVAAIPT